MVCLPHLAFALLVTYSTAILKPCYYSVAMFDWEIDDAGGAKNWVALYCESVQEVTTAYGIVSMVILITVDSKDY